jgi:hypothetical protein
VPSSSLQTRDDDVFYLFLQKQIGAELHIYLEEGTYLKRLFRGPSTNDMKIRPKKSTRIAAIGQTTPPVSHDTLLPMVFWWACFASQLVPVVWYIVAHDSQQE